MWEHRRESAQPLRLSPVCPCWAGAHPPQPGLDQAGEAELGSMSEDRPLELPTPHTRMCTRGWQWIRLWSRGFTRLMASFFRIISMFWPSPQAPSGGWLRLRVWASCWMQLLTAILLFPGTRSSSGTSTQPRERTAKHLAPGSILWM